MHYNKTKGCQIPWKEVLNEKGIDYRRDWSGRLLSF